METMEADYRRWWRRGAFLICGIPLDLLGDARPYRGWSGYNTPDYGHGFFVPIFAAFLLWQRQEMVDPWPESRHVVGFGVFCRLRISFAG